MAQEINEEDLTKKIKEEEKNVKCSFCGNDTSCEQCRQAPGEMPKFEHVCFDCYQGMKGQLPENVREKTHVCIPQEKLNESFERFLNDMTSKAFTDLWNSEKKKLKEMSRQELSQASFFEGARFMFGFMQKMSAEEGKEAKQDEKKEPK